MPTRTETRNLSEALTEDWQALHQMKAWEAHRVDLGPGISWDLHGNPPSVQIGDTHVFCIAKLGDCEQWAWLENGKPRLVTIEHVAPHKAVDAE